MTDFEQKRDAFLAVVAARPQVMGILNVTPDSFSDGGRFDSVEPAIAQAKRMEAEGCDLLDIGGESTRPGASPVDANDEIDRVLPVLKALRSQTDLPISIDTYKASVARAAVAEGAVVINDVWGLQRDPDMATTVAETGAAVIIMHNNAETDADRDVMIDMRRFLDTSLSLAAKEGVPNTRIMLDPGIGFGKTPKQSLECIERLDDLIEWYDLPVVLGLSRKRFIGTVLGHDTADRLNGTIVANMVGLERGARVLRVHDVAEHVDAIKLFNAIRNSR